MHPHWPGVLAFCAATLLLAGWSAWTGADPRSGRMLVVIGVIVGVLAGILMVTHA